MSPDSLADAVVREVRSRGLDPDPLAVRTWIRESVARAVAGGRSERHVLVKMSPPLCAGFVVEEMAVGRFVRGASGQVPLSL